MGSQITVQQPGLSRLKTGIKNIRSRNVIDKLVFRDIFNYYNEIEIIIVALT